MNGVFRVLLPKETHSNHAESVFVHVAALFHGLKTSASLNARSQADYFQEG